MNGWNDGITNAIAYIEENLTEDMDINKIADQAYVSSFYFQKIFRL
jgi:AraC family transcriptional regulator